LFPYDEKIRIATGEGSVLTLTISTASAFDVNLACKPWSQIVGRDFPTQHPYMDKDYRKIKR